MAPAHRIQSILGTLALGLLALVPAGSVLGGDLPRVSAAAPQAGGDFEAHWRVDGSEEQIPFGAAGPQSIFRHQGRLTVLDDDGFVANALSRCIGLRDARKGSMARCVWITEGGAQIFSDVDRKPAPGGQGGNGNGRIVGGTGRFSGITGSYEIRWVEQPQAAKGKISGETVSMRGRWTLPPAKAAQ
jgi:hypothetical protein